MIVGIALLNLINFDSLFHAQYRLFRELKSSVSELITMGSLPSQALLRNEASGGTIEAERNLSSYFIDRTRRLLCNFFIFLLQA